MILNAPNHETRIKACVSIYLITFLVLIVSAKMRLFFIGGVAGVLLALLSIYFFVKTNHVRAPETGWAFRVMDFSLLAGFLVGSVFGVLYLLIAV